MRCPPAASITHTVGGVTAAKKDANSTNARAHDQRRHRGDEGLIRPCEGRQLAGEQELHALRRDEMRTKSMQHVDHLPTVGANVGLRWCC